MREPLHQPDHPPHGLADQALGGAAGGQDSRFATTRWSLVLAAGQRADAAAQAALARLCELYWYPIYAFLRRRGHGADEAEDLTQGFFARVIEKNPLRDADPERGRFRAYLLACLQCYVANQRDYDGAHKRGGGARIISFDMGEAGTFGEAVKWHKRALELPDCPEEQRAECGRRLKLYEQRKPYREDAP